MEISGVSYGAAGYLKSQTQKVKNESCEQVKQFDNIISEKEAMSLEEYKNYFTKQLDSLYTHPSQTNRNEQITITDAAYERMKIDPEYEEKILNVFRQNKKVDFGNYIPVISVMHIDDTWEGCYGYTKGMTENNVISDKSHSSKSKTYDKNDKELFNYLEKIRLKREYAQEIRQKEYFEHKIEMDDLNKKRFAAESYDKQILY